MNDSFKTDFNTDYKNFLRDMDNLQGQLCNFMDNCFEKVKTPDQTIMLINRFEKLDIPCLRDEIVHKYELYALRYKVKYSRALTKLNF